MSDVSLPQELDRLLSEARQAIAQVQAAAELERLRILYLGKKSRVTAVMRSLGQLPGEERARVGQSANALKAAVESALSSKRAALAAGPSRPALDVTLPGRVLARGRRHPVTQTIETILSTMGAMGFEAVEGPELEFESYNFDGLNIPRDHPSRESFDTFFVDLPSPEPQRGRLLLRSHTSPVQIRIMERRKPPVHIVVPGKVFRPDALDASHSFMFHQVEGLLVDRGTSFADLKGVLEEFLRALFGEGTQTRFRPHYFPFTEPSAEVDIARPTDGGSGPKGTRWLEIMGCGMVHPNVLRGVGYDPREVQGFAFGMGVERIAMLKYGIHDIRQFFENDLRFLEQF